MSISFSDVLVRNDDKVMCLYKRRKEDQGATRALSPSSRARSRRRRRLVLGHARDLETMGVAYEYAGEVSRSAASGAPAGVVYSSADLEAEKLELEVA
uniref:Uncharacterized protein n=1 Tax=Oryza glumipatula TaxID=40148 RepID=A0A0D9YGI7_9ORYZ